jgi:integrase
LRRASSRPTLSRYREPRQSEEAVIRSWKRQRELIDHVVSFFGAARTVASLTKADLFAYQEHRRRPSPRPFGRHLTLTRRASEQTITRELSAFRAMCRWAAEGVFPGFDTRHPFAQLNRRDRKLLFVKDREVAREFTAEEFARLLACSPGYLRDFILLAAHTGLRHTELTGLDWKEVSLPWRTITLPASRTKSKKSRAVPLDDTALALLTALPHRTGPVLRGAKGEPVRWFTCAWKRTCRRAGIEGARIHDLRHLFAGNAAMSGMDPKTLQEVLGHSDLSLLQRYVHLTPAHKLEAVRRAGRSFSDRLESTVRAQSNVSEEVARG